MSGMICVLTGDIVRSTELGDRKLDELMKALAKESDRIRKWTQPASPRLERFRGDGWQLVLTDPTYALRAGLLLRATVKKVDQDADTRIAFGIGFGTLGSALAESSGDAFEKSGVQLEKIKGQDRWAVDGDFESGHLLPLVRALFTVCEGLTSGWTSKQADIFGRMGVPEKPKYGEVAKKLGVSPQTVQEHFARAGGRSLLRAIHGFEVAVGGISPNDLLSHKSG